MNNQKNFVKASEEGDLQVSSNFSSIAASVYISQEDLEWQSL